VYFCQLRGQSLEKKQKQKQQQQQQNKQTKKFMQGKKIEYKIPIRRKSSKKEYSSREKKFIHHNGKEKN